MIAITNDWTEHTWPIAVGAKEYSVHLWVMLTYKEVRDEYSVTGKDVQVADWSLETWGSEPASPPEHEKEIERQLLNLLEDEYGPN